MKSFLGLKGSERDKFYQSKYEYFLKLNLGAIFSSYISLVLLWVTDCQLFGRLAFETLFPRVIMVLPISLFYILVKRGVTNYRIMIPFTYFILHGIMWCTIWACYYLPTNKFSSQGFMMMQFMFLIVGFSAPYFRNIFFHLGIFLNMYVSHFFINYEDFLMLMLFGIPLYIGIAIIQYVLTNSYKEQYDLKQKLSELATVDFLTKAYNRNILTTITEPETKKFIKKLGVSIKILLLDIDFFKKINDDFGHDAGDTVLTTVSETIKSCIRDTDIFLRWGGEEFVVIMPNITLESAKMIAERIRSSVEKVETGLRGVTVSIGISDYDNDNYQESIDNSDKALYKAKESGRNQVQYFKELRSVTNN